MATPQPDTYSCTTGQGIYGGRYNTVPMDVVANVWTPTKDGNGDILSGSWANLPLDEWCSVAGTELQGLQDALVAAGFDPLTKSFGTNKTVIGTYTPWVGCATDLTNGDVWVPFSGGHADSSINGAWHINLERMGSWDISVQPSDPDATGLEWSTDYKNNTTGSFSVYTPALDTPSDILPDGLPTSRHTYNGVWYDASRNTVNTSRQRLWSFNATSKVVTNQKMYESAVQVTPTIVHDIHYDEVAQQPLGFMPRTDIDANYWAAIDPDTGTVTALPSKYTGNARAICRIGRDLMLIADNGSYGLFNMDTRSWYSTTTLTDNPVYDYQQEMQVCVYVPEWGKVLRRFAKTTHGGGVHATSTAYLIDDKVYVGTHLYKATTDGTTDTVAPTWPTDGSTVVDGGVTWLDMGVYPANGTWFLFDPTTLTHSDYTPQGITMPNPSWPGNKCFYYPARKCVIYITATALGDPSIHVMRVG